MTVRRLGWWFVCWRICGIQEKLWKLIVKFGGKLDIDYENDRDVWPEFGEFKRLWMAGDGFV